MSPSPQPLDIALDPAPFSLLPYQNAISKGVSESALFPFHRAKAAWLPPHLDGLVITSDLQGLAPDPHTGHPALLALAVVHHLIELYLDGHIPQPARMAAILAGDYFALPDTRGGFGCVAEVWHAFAHNFAQVIGVAGNHDDIASIPRSRHVQLLDSSSTSLGSLRIAGVGLIMGNARKPGRRDDHDQFHRLVATAESHPDILLLHEGPPGANDQPGHSLIGQIVSGNQIPLTICGHKHWPTPIHRTPGGSIILNAHERVIIIEHQAH